MPPELVPDTLEGRTGYRANPAPAKQRGEHMEEKFKEEKALRESHSRVSSAGRGQEPKPPGKDPAKPSEDLLEALLAAAARGRFE